MKLPAFRRHKDKVVSWNLRNCVLIQKRRKYTQEYKLEAVRLAEESEHHMAAVVRDLVYGR